MAAKRKNWPETTKLRDEIASASGAIEDVQVSLYNAIHGVGGSQVPYADADYYGEITHPSSSLIELMAQVAVRLGASEEKSLNARGVWRLDQGMGGGKSHGLIGMYHLATNTAGLAGSDIGSQVMAQATKIAGKDQVAPDLNDPHTVVLCCDNMTPGRGDKSLDGPATTLGERFLWRLFDADHGRWDEYRQDTGNKAMLGEAIQSVGRPVLILIDEIMDYIRAATSEHQSDDEQDLVGMDMAFLRAILDQATKIPNCVLVMVMIASDKDNIALNERGMDCRTELDDLLIRNGRTATVTEAKEFAEIIRRRLFETVPAADKIAALADTWHDQMGGRWRKDVFDRSGWANKREFKAKTERSYPFHPALIDLAEKEWSLTTGFQRVRSTIQVFAASVFALQQRAEQGNWVPELIGPGDLPLSSHDVREALLNSGLISDTRTVASYREIAAGEVVADDDESGTARKLDLERSGHTYANANPRAAERAATALFVYSIGPRPQGRSGAAEAEVKAATFVPDASYGSGDAEVVVAELRDVDSGLAALEEIPGRGGQALRLFLSTRQTLNMLVRAQRNAVSDGERDQAFADMARDLAKTGPFSDKVFVEAKNEDEDPRSLVEILAGAGIDDARKTRLVVLDPRRFSLLNGVDEETRDALEAGFGLGDNKLPVGWSSSAVFAVVNTQRRAHARGLLTNHLALQRVSEMDAVRGDDDLADRAADELAEAKRRSEQAVRDAYQHVVYLGETSTGGREPVFRRFDKDGLTSLAGNLVWADLCTANKALDSGEFTAKALLHNLRDEDYGKPLPEIRDSFWNTPRLPLLFGGEQDLRSALFEVISDKSLQLVDASGKRREATSVGDINLGAAGLRLSRPVGDDTVTVPDLVGKNEAAARLTLESLGLTYEPSGAGTEVVGQKPAPGEQVVAGSTVTLTLKALDPVTEQMVSVAVSGSLQNDPDRQYQIHKLLNLLAEVVDGHSSHIQMTAKITVKKDKSDEIVAQAEAADAQEVNARDM